MTYLSTKTYGHEQGFSCCFRQWRADSHCNLLHGYALSFKFTFSAETLDKNGWVVDFGDLDDLKNTLRHYFDHTMLVAEDDPALHLLGSLDRDIDRDNSAFNPVANIRYMEAVGCEAFAKFMYRWTEVFIGRRFPHARLVSCEVREHNGNGASYVGEIS